MEKKAKTKQKCVQVLLSAYYGEKYLPAQLDSILAQKGVRVSVLIRDDGSGGGTQRVLRRYAKKHANVSVYAGKNLGVAKSFFDLLAHADPACGYYAFADQDDVWMEGKLARAVSFLERIERKYPGRPLLYAGNVVYASGSLQIQETVPSRCSRKPSFGNALTENICMGCTQVFNRRLLELAASRLPAGNILHDWWMYLTAAYFGSVLFDQEAYMLYRQHKGNQIGMQRSWYARWKNRLLHFASLRHRLSGQAVLFRDAYAELLDSPAQDRYAGRYRNRRNARSLALLCGYRTDRKKKIRLVFDKNVYRQNLLDDLAYRILFLSGYL